MNTNGRYGTRTPDVATSVSGLTHDMIELTELQAQLFRLDLQKSTARTRRCLIFAVVALCVLLGTIPVVLYALAEVLVEQLDWARSAALGVAALVGLVLAAILGGIAYAYVRKGLLSLDRSREEFNQNVAWIKSTLRSGGRPASAARRPMSPK